MLYLILGVLNWVSTLTSAFDKSLYATFPPAKESFRQGILEAEPCTYRIHVITAVCINTKGIGRMNTDVPADSSPVRSVR